MASPYRYLKFWLLPFLRSRIRVEGLDHLPADGRFVVTPNHRSWIDSALVAAALYKNIPKTLKFISKSNKYPYFGALAIPDYDRGEVLQVALGYIHAGHPVVLFPEGNAHKDGSLRHGKTGAARLSLAAHAPIVPIAIIGTHGIQAWKAALWFFAWWMPCTIRIGTPYHLDPLPAQHTKEDLYQRTDTIISNIHQLLTSS
jgi:1-acyl-sn-glycerol-3-phosphate acyltransferase